MSETNDEEQWIVYVLFLEQGKFYIGQTKRHDERFEEHLSGVAGSAWTRKYRPIRGSRPIVKIVSTEKASKELERIITIDYMENYGIENVRGSDYSCPGEIKGDDLKAIRKTICGNNNLCYRCGEPKHFASECPNR